MSAAAFCTLPLLGAMFALTLAWPPAHEPASVPPSVMVPEADSARRLLASELQHLVPGDIRTVKFTEWLAMPVAPQTTRVIGRALLDAGGHAITVAFRASVDQDSGKVMHLSYRMLEMPAQAATAASVPDSVLRQRIGGEMVARFPGQAMDFRIVAIHQRARLGQHLVIEGEGISDFFEEGQVHTPFVATFVLPSAQLVRLDYELAARADEATWVAGTR